MAVGDIYRVAIEGSCDGGQIVNVLHYQTAVSVGPLTGEVLALADAIETKVVAGYDDLCSQAVHINNIKVRGITNPTAGVDQATAAIGTKTGDSLPNQITCLVLIKSGLIGRSQNGRCSMFPTVESDLAANAWGSTYRAAVAAAWDDWMSIEDASFGGVYHFNLVVYSEKLSVAYGVNAISVVNGPRVQRRRRPGSGS